MSRWIYHSEAEFEAAHALARYLGEPEHPHSHRWKVALTAGADRLNDEHYALDFHALHRILQEAARALDGVDLGAHPVIGNPSPTAENLALHLADTVRGPIEELGGTLLEISVWEGPGNRVDLRVPEGP